MTYIKAIETEFKGYRFRSRLEARWAVFFDWMGIDFEYEPEGYILEDGRKYLPDFLIPEWECYAEAKHGLFTIDEYYKASHLPQQCILLDGYPDNRPYYVTGLEWTSFDNYMSGAEYGRIVFEYSICKNRIWYLFGESYSSYFCPDTEGAILRVRSARFEHGENPEPIRDVLNRVFIQQLVGREI